MQQKNIKTELYKAIKAINIENLNSEDKEELLKIFMHTKNPLIRDSIALIFAKVHYNEAIPFILKKINEKDLYNHNGTLVYSLEDLDVQKYFIDFIKIICEQAYEARLMAYEIVEKSVNFISNRTRKRALQILESYLLKEKDMADNKYENSTQHFMESTRKLLLPPG
jgi:hypothetical protein